MPTTRHPWRSSLIGHDLTHQFHGTSRPPGQPPTAMNTNAANLYLDTNLGASVQTATPALVSVIGHRQRDR